MKRLFFGSTEMKGKYTFPITRTSAAGTAAFSKLVPLELQHSVTLFYGYCSILLNSADGTAAFSESRMLESHHSSNQCCWNCSILQINTAKYFLIGKKVVLCNFSADFCVH